VNDDFHIRLAAFDWIKIHEAPFQGVFPRDFLAKGFVFQGERVPLVSPQGIYKPKQLSIPLSITTTANGPYRDAIDDNNVISYSYRGANPQHPDNIGLREAMKQQVPLIYFHALAVGKYKAIWPVFIVGDNPTALMFTVAADEPSVLTNQNLLNLDSTPIRRGYVMAEVQRRVHQAAFRERVLGAYRESCSLCRLNHPELLDAAHIIPDREERGEPRVSNGLSLCKIHHAAFDSEILGISPDYVVHIRKDILEEIDGPMLKHGLQEMAGAKLLLPRTQTDWPDRDSLDLRFKQFAA
jgi:putative restriction endonuclease